MTDADAGTGASANTDANADEYVPNDVILAFAQLMDLRTRKYPTAWQERERDSIYPLFARIGREYQAVRVALDTVPWKYADSTDPQKYQDFMNAIVGIRHRLADISVLLAVINDNLSGMTPDKASLFSDNR